MKVLGIDPGYDRLGIAIIEKNGSRNTLLHSSCFTTSPKDTFYKRLHEVGTHVAQIIKEHAPDRLAIETLFITKNQRTAMRVSETRGVIIYEAIRSNIPVFEYSPPEIKTAVTGHGRSDKEHVTKMIPLLVKMPPNHKALDDEYDAIAVGLTCIAIER